MSASAPPIAALCIMNLDFCDILLWHSVSASENYPANTVSITTDLTLSTPIRRTQSLTWMPHSWAKHHHPRITRRSKYVVVLERADLCPSWSRSRSSPFQATSVNFRHWEEGAATFGCRRHHKPSWRIMQRHCQRTVEQKMIKVKSRWQMLPSEADGRY